MAKQTTSEPGAALVALKQAYPALAGGGAVAEAMAANLGGEQITVFDLERIRMPSGGALAFEIMGADGEPQYVQHVEGIIVFTKMGRSYWSVSLEESGGGSPPDCSSPDGVRGFGDPGGACAECPLSQFGSAPDGKPGQACRQQRFVFLLREGAALPTVLTLPPTSLKAMKKWLVGISTKGRPYWTLLTRFQLRSAQNKSGIKYAEVVPSVVRMLTEDEVGEVTAFAMQTRQTFDSFREGHVPLTMEEAEA